MESQEKMKDIVMLKKTIVNDDIKSDKKEDLRLYLNSNNSDKTKNIKRSSSFRRNDFNKNSNGIIFSNIFFNSY